MADAPMLVSTSGAGRRQSAGAAWRELWHGRDVVRAFLGRSLRVRYRQALLGAAWAMIQPLALLVPIALFLADETPRVDGVRFAASTLAALIGWSYLSGAVTAASGALVSEAILVRKAWFPREAPVLAAIGAALVDLALATAVGVVAVALLGGRLGIALFALPLAVLALVAVALAIALPLAGINALFRDVRHALPFGVLLWLFATPVMYPASRVPVRWRTVYAAANPAVGPVEAFRRSLAHDAWPAWGLLLASLAGAALIGIAGHALFRRLAPSLADVI